jgi:hypothetical protein
MMPGLLTSIVYFIGHNIYTAIIFHSFQALYGVISNIPLTQYLQLQYPLLILAGVSILAIIICNKYIFGGSVTS